MLPKLSADFSHDEWRVIHERRRGWEKAAPDLLANVFGTTPAVINHIVRKMDILEKERG